MTALGWQAHADENLPGYTRSAETLPAGAARLYQTFTRRSDKGAGTYRAVDPSTGFEYGITERLTGTVGLKHRLSMRAGC